MNELIEDAKKHASAFSSLVAGRHGDPFSLLGIHQTGGKRIVRTFQPQATAVWLIDAQGKLLASMERVHKKGIYSALMPARKRRYLLRIQTPSTDGNEIEDPYRFPSSIGELDLYLLGEGSHQDISAKLGAHRMKMFGIDGTRFAVWAPNASRVSVVGDFNEWDGRRHVMRLHPANGIWEIFVPAVGTGSLYKFEILDNRGELLPLKFDPLAQYYESPPGNASIVYQSKFRWHDAEWMAKRRIEPSLDQPVSIYEVHLGSWRRKPEQNNRSLNYRELADELIAYVRDMGFTHIELLPITEHPFEGSWGYQPIGMFAPTQRFGEPDDFRYFVDCSHRAGIGVIIDWVPAHFPRDEHGLHQFDGTALYEHEDPRKGEHADWDTLIYNYGRREVVNYLIGSALHWVTEFHIDALRVDAVASMLYLDYSRKDGEWIPNEFGGNENLEAVEFMRRLNREIHAEGAMTFAEESTAWPGVSHPTYTGGLGFTYKWNMGWMNDTLEYIQQDPVHRKHHHDKMTFGLVYAFNENFVLPLSHDEVVHGKGSLLDKIPGSNPDKFATLRAYYGAMYCHPGKKLLFMGAEFAQFREWDHDSSLDWHLLEYPLHKGVQKLIQDLNLLYRQTPMLYQIDFSPEGFEWIDWQDRDSSVFSWIRRDSVGNILICVMNCTPVIRHGYRIGVPSEGDYRELINTDSAEYGGDNQGNLGKLTAQEFASHGRPFSLTLTLPSLATVILTPATMNKLSA